MLASKCGNQARFLHTSVTRLADSSITIKGSGHLLPFKGVDAAKKPVKVKLEKGKTYLWCSCGLSANQPWCDHSEQRMGMSDLRPVEFVAETTCEKWICMCKQTNHRPFCDGVHKTIDQTPRDDNRSRYVMYKTGPVYEGVAKKLGYIVKDGEQ